ncbi:hypothetical protein J4449_02760 [Candidatus Woesearchaeota archaeon]|nr:hypothetical protein [Candidatus Woesearchaeota archaeon]
MDEKDKKLKNSEEIYLTPQQLYILSLEKELGKMERELQGARQRVNYLEDELFAESAGFFLEQGRDRIIKRFFVSNKLERITRKLSESITSRKEDGFYGKLSNLVFFAYAGYVFAITFLFRHNGNNRKGRYY